METEHFLGKGLKKMKALAAGLMAFGIVSTSVIPAFAAEETVLSDENDEEAVLLDAGSSTKYTTVSAAVTALRKAFVARKTSITLPVQISAYKNKTINALKLAILREAFKTFFV